MRFSIRNRSINIEDIFQNSELENKVITKLEIQNGQLYVYWGNKSDSESHNKFQHIILRNGEVIGEIDCPVLALDIDSKIIHNTAIEPHGRYDYEVAKNTFKNHSEHDSNGTEQMNGVE